MSELQSSLVTGKSSQDDLQSDSECGLLFHLATLALERGDIGHAADLLRHLQLACPDQPLYLRAMGEVLLEQQLYSEALAFLQRSLALDPMVAESHFYAGLAAQGLGEIRAARNYYSRAADLDPSWAEAWFNLGTIDLRQGESALAEQAFRRCLETRPDWPPALLNLGTVLFETGREDQAAACWQKALAIEPRNAQAHYNLGRFFQTAQKTEKAISAYLAGLKIDPGLAKACLNLGKCYHDLGRHAEAALSYERAIAIDPDYAQAWYNLAATRMSQGDHDSVIACYRKVVDLQPDNDAAHLNLSIALRRREFIDEAMAHCKKALDITPNFVEARAFLFQLSQHACDWDLAARVGPSLDEDTRHCLASGREPGESPMLSLRRRQDPGFHLEVARVWSHRISCEIKSRHPDLRFDHSSKRYPGERIRLGYISNDFKDHAVAQQIRGLLAAHDRNRFEVFAYGCNPSDQSFYQERIRQSCDHYIHLNGLSDEAAARRIYDDRVQLLVDLMGHTRGNRLPILALRPAPVQISYLGFLGTSGTDFIDYLITDKVVTPADQARFYSEKLVFLPHCYQANDDAMPVPADSYKRSDFGLADNAVVFCCFNQPYKIDPVVFNAWMAILKTVPNGVLWLLNQSAATVRNLKQAAAKGGVQPERLVFSGALRIDKHLSRLLLADIALDPFIYNGGATTSNALWAGLPVITKIGTHFLSRMSASALMAVGLSRLVTQTADQYVQTAVELARNQQLRIAIRHRLQQGRGRFPLFNTRLFAQHLSTAYATMWDHYKNGLTARSFSVELERTSTGDEFL